MDGTIGFKCRRHRRSCTSAVHAPDSSPKEDYLRDDEQITLETAFTKLRGGMAFVEPKVSDSAQLDTLRVSLTKPRPSTVRR